MSDTDIPWARARAADVAGVDLDAALAREPSCDAEKLARALRAASQERDAESAERRVFDMLAAALDMHPQPDDPNAPYIPFMQFGDQRTAAPEDFRGEALEAMAACVERTSHPILRARLCDLVWFLDRSRHAMGRQALRNHAKILDELDEGTLASDEDRSALGLLGHQCLVRALWIARGLGKPEPEYGALLARLAGLRNRAASEREFYEFRRFTRTDLEWSASLSEEVGRRVEQFFDANPKIEVHSEEQAKLWRLAEKAYRKSSRTDEANACQMRAVDCYVALADFFAGKSALQERRWVDCAIRELQGLPNAKERRTQLKLRSTEVGQEIEFGDDAFVEIPARELIAHLEEEYSVDLPACLERFARIDRSPDPKELEEKARLHLLDNSLAAQFLVAPLASNGMRMAWPSNAHSQEIAFIERIRRNSSAFIADQARKIIARRHFIALEDIRRPLDASPCVAPEQRQIASLGFLCFFRGQIIEALHLLAPFAESVVRRILTLNGHDVTKIDDATVVGEFLSIQSLFKSKRAEIDACFGAALARDLERVFTGDDGPRLRHRVAHGLLSDDEARSGEAVYACWLLWRVCCLPILARWDDIHRAS